MLLLAPKRDGVGGPLGQDVVFRAQIREVIVRRILFARRLLAFGVFIFAASVPVRALSAKVFVTPLGKDSASCGALLSPCKTFVGAVAAVSPGGTVVVLTPGEYGSVTITKALTIQAVEGTALVQASGDAVTISAGATDVVTLRGLTLANASRSGSAVMINSAGAVHIEKCTLAGFINGVFAFAWSGKLFLLETTARNNDEGLNVRSPSGHVDVAIERSVFEGNSIGVLVQDGTTMAIRGGASSGNLHGIVAQGSFGGGAIDLTIADCVVANNQGSGIVSEADGPANSAVVRVSGSTVTGNGVGLFQYYPSPGSAVLVSRGNNTVEANQTNQLGTIGAYAAK